MKKLIFLALGICLNLQGAVVITSPTPNETVSSTPHFSGTAMIGGGDVTIKVDGVTLGTAFVSPEGGFWNFDVVDPLSSGGHTLRVEQGVDFATVNFNVSGASLTIRTPANLENVGQLPTYAGTARGGSAAAVTLYIDNRQIGQAPIVNGQWSLTQPIGQPLSLGNHTLRATYGGASASVEFICAVEILSPKTGDLVTTNLTSTDNAFINVRVGTTLATQFDIFISNRNELDGAVAISTFRSTGPSTVSVNAKLPPSLNVNPPTPVPGQYRITVQAGAFPKVLSAPQLPNVIIKNFNVQAAPLDTQVAYAVMTYANKYGSRL